MIIERGTMFGVKSWIRHDCHTICADQKETLSNSVSQPHASVAQKSNRATLAKTLQ
jgi:hypothetical protein